jgi:hypothetical protein
MKSSGNMPIMQPSVIPNADPELLAIRTEARRSCDGLVAGVSEWRGESRHGSGTASVKPCPLCPHHRAGVVDDSQWGLRFEI